MFYLDCHSRISTSCAASGRMVLVEAWARETRERDSGREKRGAGHSVWQGYKDTEEEICFLPLAIIPLAFAACALTSRFLCPTLAALARSQAPPPASWRGAP